MNRVTGIFIGLFFLCISTAFPTIINIPSDYPTVQAGINASSDGDTVLVQPGTYIEFISFNGHNIVLASLFLTSGDESYIETTFLQAPDVGPIVLFSGYEDSTSALIGFTLQNGFSQYGAGILCDEASPKIKYNIIKNNDAEGLNPYFYPGFGGGMALLNSHASIEHCVFEDNVAEGYSDGLSGWGGKGGAIFAEGGDIRLSNCIFIHNVASTWVPETNGLGGALYCSDASITNCLFFENEAAGSGQQPVNGGGIYVSGPSDNFFVTGSIFRGNIGEEISAGDSAVVTYSNIEGGWQGAGNIDTDPLFRDPENGDFHLMSIACGDSADSPCIDAGHPAIIDSLLDCSWGLGIILSDMGAYGGGESIQVSIDDNLSSNPDRFSLFQNYPNPFNASTTIRFVLPQTSEVTASIYNLLGQRVATILEDRLPAGEYNIVWNADDYPSGVYFARLETSNHSRNIKMVLLK